MSVSSLALPPLFSKDSSYEDFKKELNIWKLLKSCTDKEQGPLVFRSLTGKAKTAALELTEAEIGADDGLSKILGKLDKLFLPDDNQRTLAALEKFESLKRSPSMTMASFILEFEKLHNQLKTFGCTYPDGVLAFRLMRSAGMSKEHEQLCRATVETDKWSYATVKQQIRKIFNDYVALKFEPESSTVTEKTLPIKVEENYFTQDRFPESSPSPSCNYEDINSLSYDNYTEDNSEFDMQISEDQLYGYREPEQFDVYYGPSRNSRGPWNSNRPSYGNFRGRRYPGGWRTGPGPQKYQKSFGNQGMNEAAGSNNSGNSAKPNPYNMNPRDYRGNPTVCRKCRSLYHWWENCPHVTPQERSNSSKKVFLNQNNLQEDLYIALFQKSTPTTADDITMLMGETTNMALIDSGCSKSCCGEKWYNAYLDTLTKSEAEAIKNKKSTAVFRFGDSDPVKATNTVRLPLKIQNIDFTLETEVVPCDVPLLLSKETMKRAGAKMNFVDDKIELFGEEVPMICTSSGHYAIPVVTSDPSSIVLYTDNKPKDPKSIAKKLHFQFGHATDDRLLDLMVSWAQGDEELKQAIKEVYDGCDICKLWKKPSPRPVVSLPMATQFNETIAMDLKIYEHANIYFLHIIDHLTRFSAAAVIRSKSAETIMTNFLKSWIAIFGSPRKVLSDNGGEFANQKFMDMCENLNINFQTTAAESPWSNGLVERHNAIIGETVAKIVEHTHCSVEIALCWAIQAKNSLQNIHGFSSYQLVFGRNPVLPSVLDNKLPALEGVSESQIIADNLNAQHQARVEMIKAEASEKISRALRAQTRTYSNMRYLNGEEVFYKRDNQKKWKGPGRVIGQDGSKVLIKVPTGLITVHSCRVILTSDAERQRLGVKEIQIENATENPEITAEDDEVPVDPTESNQTHEVIERMLTRSRVQDNSEDNKEQHPSDSINNHDDDQREETEPQNDEHGEVNHQLEGHEHDESADKQVEDVVVQNTVKNPLI